MSIIERIDHLVYAAPDLDSACADLERRFGVQPSVGGRHPGRGTHNALVAVGPACYIEIVAPDPSQPQPPTRRWFRIDELSEPRLVAWAAKARDLPRLVQSAAEAGTHLGSVAAGSRQRPDGALLEWALTEPDVMLGDGIVPFFIDWGASPHPAWTAARGPTLVDLRAEHPDPEHVRGLLAGVGLDLVVEHATRPKLVASFTRGSEMFELS